MSVRGIKYRVCALTEFELQALVHAYTEVVTESMELMVTAGNIDNEMTMREGREEASDAMLAIEGLLDVLAAKLAVPSEDDD